MSTGVVADVGELDQVERVGLDLVDLDVLCAGRRRALVGGSLGGCGGDHDGAGAVGAAPVALPRGRVRRIDVGVDQHVAGCEQPDRVAATQAEHEVHALAAEPPDRPRGDAAAGGERVGVVVAVVLEHPSAQVHRTRAGVDQLDEVRVVGRELVDLHRGRRGRAGVGGSLGGGRRDHELTRAVGAPAVAAACRRMRRVGVGVDRHQAGREESDRVAVAQTECELNVLAAESQDRSGGDAAAARERVGVVVGVVLEHPPAQVHRLGARVDQLDEVGAVRGELVDLHRSRIGHGLCRRGDQREGYREQQKGQEQAEAVHAWSLSKAARASGGRTTALSLAERPRVAGERTPNGL